MLEPFSSKKCLLHHHFTCPVCGTTGQHVIFIYDAEDRRKYDITQLQCLDCFNTYSNIHDKNHNIIDHIIEDEKDDRDYLG